MHTHSTRDVCRSDSGIARPRLRGPSGPEPRARISHELRERLRDFALQNGGVNVAFAPAYGVCVMRMTDRHHRSHEVEIHGDEGAWHAALDEFDRYYCEAPVAGLSRFLAASRGGRS